MTNEEMDAKVVEAVNTGAFRASRIQAYVGTDSRSLDRSLQRLRRAGKLAYTSALGWSLA